MAIVDVLLSKCLNGESLKEVVDSFKHKFGFPQCAGAVDDTRTHYFPRGVPCGLF